MKLYYTVLPGFDVHHIRRPDAFRTLCGRVIPRGVQIRRVYIDRDSKRCGRCEAAWMRLQRKEAKAQ